MLTTFVAGAVGATGSNAGGVAMPAPRAVSRAQPDARTAATGGRRGDRPPPAGGAGDLLRMPGVVAVPGVSRSRFKQIALTLRGAAWQVAIGALGPRRRHRRSATHGHRPPAHGAESIRRSETRVPPPSPGLFMAG